MSEIGSLAVREGVDRETVETLAAMEGNYRHGWETDIEMEFAPKGLNEDIVRMISEKNKEPDWLTEWRLTALNAGRGWTSPIGQWSIILPSTIRTNISMPNPRV